MDESTIAARRFLPPTLLALFLNNIVVPGPRAAWNPESTRLQGVPGKKVDPESSLRAVRDDDLQDAEE